MKREICEQDVLYEVAVDLAPKPPDDFRATAQLVSTIWGLRRYVDVIEAELGQAIDEHQLEKDRANLDELTGLKNFRAFNEFFPRKCDEMRLTGKHIALFYFDVDGLKRVNDDKDRCGYDTGNQLLQLVADKARSIIRVGDEVFRIYGDELVVVLPNFTADRPEFDSRQRSQRVDAIRNKFDDIINNAIQNSPNIPRDLYVGVSVGSATLRINEDNQTFLKRAETNMFERKQSRKEDLLDEGVVFLDDRLI